MKKKILKIIGMVIAIFTISYSIFIVEEVIRFNNNLGAKPLITIKQNADIGVGQQFVNEEYIGLGYTIEYKTSSRYKENSDIIIFGGDFKLFGKILISAWVQ